MAKIKVYGADWCAMTQRTLHHLKERGADFEYIDVEADPAASEWVKQQNGGKEKKPTVDFNGQVVSEPTNSELDDLLSRAAA